MSRRDDARVLLRSIFATEADIVLDDSAGTLTIRLHQPANRSKALNPGQIYFLTSTANHAMVRHA
ncbi:MAG: hypothetical protein BWK76_25945 [Desulfobulbaceae bacterium A2]|nr:MAG: hypothetical protein BWK76_25945 [Desulfobulbaceae bacterium A2]